MSRTLLIDADIVAYKYSAANEKAWNFDGPDAPPLRSADFAAAIDCASDFITELRETLGTPAVIVCLTDPKNNFRKSIYPNYKSNRVGVRKPEHLMAVKEWLSENFQTYLRPGLEADDCMGILATHPSLIKGDKIMVSEDKDMKTIPGLLYNPREEKPKVRTITKRDACRAHFIQTIVGDTSDGYPGAPGIGAKSPEVKAIEAAREPSTMWPEVINAFMRAHAKVTGMSAETSEEIASVHAAALQQARLARILRASDWNFTQKCPILWTPPT